MKRPSLSTHFAPALHPLALAALLALLPSGAAMALPSGEQVVAGQVAVSRPGAGQMLIRQQGDKGIVNWRGFSIGAGEAVRVQQPGASSVLLNRVVGGEASQILGRLQANGKLFLVNQNGVLFGRDAQVDVGSLVGSTLDIRDDDFLAGRLRFAGPQGIGASASGIVNQGRISAAERGTVALLGGSVRNDGLIEARLGTVALGAGSRITLDLAGDGLSSLRIDEAALQAQVASGGALLADGGAVLLTARAIEELASGSINASGVVRARSLVERDGRIVLDAGTGPGGGTTLASGQLDASGDPSNNAVRGGSIALLGRHVGVTDAALLDASGAAGGGQILVGGDAHGANPAVPNAQASYVGPQAVLRADAIRQGDGGRIVVWGDDAARAYGSLSARGGSQGGNGGFIETSGKFLDVAGARIDASAPRGSGGEWLLDPLDIGIGNSAVNGSTQVTASPNFTATGTAAFVNAADIEAALNQGFNVTVSTGSDPLIGQPGDIGFWIGTTINKTAGGDATLRLNAHNDIYTSIDGPARTTITSSSGRLHVDLNSDSDGNGVGGIYLAQFDLRSNGGNVSLHGGSDPGRPAAGNSSHGIELRNAAIDTRRSDAAAAGDVLLRGRGSDGGPESFAFDGVRLSDTTSIITGNAAAPSAGSSGSITIIGTSGRGNAGQGVQLANDVRLESTGGSIDLRGRSESSGGHGTLIEGNSRITTSRGAITIGGESTSGSASGLYVAQDAQGQAVIGGPPTTGTVVLRAAAPAGVDSLDLFGLVQTSGVFNMRPGGVDAAGNLSEWLDVPITLGTSSAPVPADRIGMVINQPGGGSAATLVIGSAQHRGLITVHGAITPGTDLSLQNGGAGSRGIEINAPIDASGHALLLQSGGAVTQAAAGAPLRAGSLLLNGTQPASRFMLNDAFNDVQTLAMRFDAPRDAAIAGAGNVEYANNGALTIGAVTVGGAAPQATAIDAPTGMPGQPVAVVSPGSSVAGELRLFSRNGNLRLTQDIATSDGDILLATPQLLDNAGGNSLSPGNGHRWSVWAGTWVGETRGGLAPTTPRPNYYGCDLDGLACGAGVEMPTGGNHFFYAAQPTVTVRADDKGRSYGSANPALTATTSGLVNGDTAADAFGGVLQTTAAPSSPVDGYPITASVATSPVGYLVSFTPGTLTVDPALLTVTAPSASRVAGATNPALAPSYAGFMLGENESVLTTPASVSTNATSASPAGVYATVASGASARNYSLRYVDGQLTVTAAPQIPQVPQTPSEPEQPPATTPPATTTPGTTTLPVITGNPRILGWDAPSGPSASAFQLPTEPTAAGPSDADASAEAGGEGSGITLPLVCIVSDVKLDRTLTGADLLDIEWARVRSKASLNSCVELGRQNACSDF